MRAIFIRHAESTANVGAVSADVATIGLTNIGIRQAEDVASKWMKTPTLIVVSSFLRTQQTAAPTKARFSDVPLEVWPVHEFTYLAPKRWNGTCRADRLPALEQYWTTCDPCFCDGEGAESFTQLLGRVHMAIERLSHFASDALVCVFTHGQFMQALQSMIEAPHLKDTERMRGFWRREKMPVANVQQIVVEIEAGAARIVQSLL